MRLDAPEVVREEYASEARLAAREAAHRFGTGPDARRIAFDAIAEVRPRRLLESPLQVRRTLVVFAADKA